MNIKNVPLAMLAIWPAILHADLFDTEDQLSARYGEVISAKDGVWRKELKYRTEEYEIEAWVRTSGVFEGKCVWQWTKRADGKALGDREIDALLGSRLGKWNYVGDDKWKIGNFATAHYYGLGRTLSQKLEH